MDTSSVGSFLFESYLRFDGSQTFVNPWSPADPLGTPNTLMHPEIAADALRAAMAREHDAGRALNTSFGEFNWLPVGVSAHGLHRRNQARYPANHARKPCAAVFSRSSSIQPHDIPDRVYIILAFTITFAFCVFYL